jgi:hypothetical protein
MGYDYWIFFADLGGLHNPQDGRFENEALHSLHITISMGTTLIGSLFSGPYTLW